MLSVLTTGSSEQQTRPRSWRSGSLHRSDSQRSEKPCRAQSSLSTHSLQWSCHPQWEQHLQYRRRVPVLNSLFKWSNREILCKDLHAAANRARRMKYFMFVFCACKSTHSRGVCSSLIYRCAAQLHSSLSQSCSHVFFHVPCTLIKYYPTWETAACLKIKNIYIFSFYSSHLAKLSLCNMLCFILHEHF